MSLPPPTKRRNQPSGPGLTTRAGNKNIHPAQLAGLVPKTAEERAEDNERAAEVKAQSDRTKDSALAAIAAIEDEQRRKDIEYGETAHHPPPPARPQRRIRTPQLSPEEEEEMNLGKNLQFLPLEFLFTCNADPEANDSESGDSDSFRPPDESNDSGDDEDEPDASEDDEGASAAPPRKKNKKFSRADIQAARQTQDITGTPEIGGGGGKRKANDNGEKSVAKKTKIAKKSGMVSGAKERLKRREAKGTEDSDGMVHYGGPAIDDDADEIVEREKKGKGRAQASIVRIVAPAKRVTQKELRGDGSKRWTVKHIPGPAGNGDTFTDTVWPNLRKELGQLPPWHSLSDAQVQGVLDKFFTKFKMNAKDDVWQGLIMYRTNTWRAGFPLQAHRCVVDMVDNAKKRAEDGTAPPDEIPLHTPEGMKDYVASMLELDEANYKMKVFQWREWDEVQDKYTGLFQSSIILFTYSYHLAFLAALPGGLDVEAPAIGALLLASQAMERELGFWATGLYVPPGRSQKEQFSNDNWGDYTAESATTQRLMRRATYFVDSLKQLQGEQWEKINSVAASYLPKNKRARSRSASCSSSSDVEMVIEEETPLLIEFS
ncbi:hypothetical protein R3P38DRAFT_3283719 [Favolaschia claudopus]|uniref:Uncharacterized protein n=1 Tax=Favolaschia claudopus TaxID=2862362 RepID=A0AAW0A6L5_9AGAR